MGGNTLVPFPAQLVLRAGLNNNPRNDNGSGAAGYERKREREGRCCWTRPKMLKNDVGRRGRPRAKWVHGWLDGAGVSPTRTAEDYGGRHHPERQGVRATSLYAKPLCGPVARSTLNRHCL